MNADQSRDNLKLVFFGGKGGVGKTTCASAYAVKAAKDGKNTLLVSTDLAHSLSDLFGKTIGGQATELGPGLSGLEIDPDREAQNYIEEIRSRFSPRMEREASRAFSRQLDLAASSPGTQEAALFDRITDLVTRSGTAYDIIVFDTAPTGQTLRLLMLPELMGSWIDALTTQRSRVSSFFKMFTRASGIPDREDPILELLVRRRENFLRFREILTNPQQTGFYFVLIPEKLPIIETEKAIPRLQEFGVPIRGIIVNRVLPSEADGDFLKKRKIQEQVYLSEISKKFIQWPLIRAHQFESDISKPRDLAYLAERLFGSLPTQTKTP